MRTGAAILALILALPIAVAAGTSPISVPLLDGRVGLLIAGTRDVAFAWSGGSPPYALAIYRSVPWQARPVATLRDVGTTRAVFRGLPLTPGLYFLEVRAPNRPPGGGFFRAEPSTALPPFPGGDDLQKTQYARRLSQQERSDWALEAVQQLADVSGRFAPAAALRTELESAQAPPSDETSARSAPAVSMDELFERHAAAYAAAQASRQNAPSGGIGDAARAALHDYEDALDLAEAATRLDTTQTEQFFFAAGYPAQGVFSQMQRLRNFDDFIAFLYDLHERAPRAGYDAEALRVFDRTKGRELLDTVSQSVLDRYFLTAQEQTELRILGGEVGRIEFLTWPYDELQFQPELWQERDEIARARLVVRDLRAHFAVLHPGYAASPASPVASIDALRGALKSGEALLVYDVTSSGTFVWVLEPGATHTLAFLRLSDATFARVAELVAEYRNGPARMAAAIQQGADIASAARKTTGGFVQIGFELGRLLVPETVSRRITGAKTVYVVPTGPLNNLPFEALVTSDPSSGPPQYLVAQHAIAYLSSASLLAFLRSPAIRSHRHAPRPLFAAAVQTFAGGSVDIDRHPVPLCHLDPLPQTEQQATEIGKIMNAAPEDILLGDAATRTELQDRSTRDELQNYRYLVFATHALLQPCNPQRGPYGATLVLADPTGRGDIDFTLEQSAILSLNADLAVLSACDTGLSVDPSGDGSTSLPGAFMSAGARAVAGTTWLVEANASSALTTAMFRRLARGETIAEALRGAKLDMLSGADEALHNPYFWAPFIGGGDAE